MGPELNIFTIYTLEDSDVMQHIVRRLKSSEKEANISIWNDDPILQDQAWKPKNESRLDKTDIFILFVSDAFMHSHFIQQLEFKNVIDSYKAGKSTVIPVILDKCPWDIDFRSDDYNFNLNELGVLPNGGKPINEWNSSEQIYDDIAKEIKGVIKSLSGSDIQEEPKIDEEEKVEDVKTDEQVAIPFDEQKEAEEKKRHQEEIEAKQIAEEKRAKEEAESKKRVVEEQRRREEAESKRRAEEQKQRAASESPKLEEQKRLQKEAEQRIEEENRQKVVAASTETNEEEHKESTLFGKKRLLIGALVALLAIIGIWTLNRSSDDVVEPSVNSKTTEVEDSIAVETTEIEPVVEEESLPELTVGDRYEEGIVFAIDADGKNGQIVHIDDAGPMTWENAIQIHEQLGEGWRLPTLDELRILYKTVGQGASNAAEFSNGMYWSATDYDEYQARLLRFRDGNTSYHYNKVAEHRKYRVRAIRDFSR